LDFKPSDFFSQINQTRFFNQKPWISNQVLFITQTLFFNQKPWTSNQVLFITQIFFFNKKTLDFKPSDFFLT
jgi:hypothetical protein